MARSIPLPLRSPFTLLHRAPRLTYVDQNLEYARTLLTKLEQDALNVKIHAHRQELQVDLNRKREVFDQLAERLRELDDLGIDSDDDDDSSDGEDLLRDIIQTPSASESQDSRSPERGRSGPGWDVDEGHGWDDAGEDESYAEESTVIPEPTRREPAPEATQTKTETTQTTATAAPKPTSTPQTGSKGTSTSQSLRPRGGTSQPSQPDTAETTARSQLFGNRPSSATTALNTTATTEAILDHQRQEQDKLTESLLSMAQSLKSQSRAFQTDLEQEKDILTHAGSGMEKSERGMEAASRRMGALRKMSEGKGWWGRMMLYAWIFGLMVIAVLIVGVLPKLRF